MPARTSPIAAAGLSASAAPTTRCRMAARSRCSDSRRPATRARRATTGTCTSAASPRACSPTARAWKSSASISATATSRPSRASATSFTTTTTIRRPAALRTSWSTAISASFRATASATGRRIAVPAQSIPTAEWRQEDPGVIPSGDVYGGGAPTGIVFNEGDGLGEKWRGLLLSRRGRAQHHLRLFPEADGAGYQLERFDFLTSNKAQDFAGTDFKGGKVNERDPDVFPALGCRRRAGWRDLRRRLVRSARRRPRRQGRHHFGSYLPHRAEGFHAARAGVRCARRWKASSQRCAVRPSMCARWVSTASRRAVRRRCGRCRHCSMTSNPVHARACRVAARAAGRRWPGARREIAGQPGRHACGSRRTARCGRRAARSVMRRGWRVILRPRCGAKWRCHSATCRSRRRARCC